MQLGLGLELARKGWQTAWYANGKTAPARGWWGPEGLFLSLFALAFTLVALYPREVSKGRWGQAWWVLAQGVATPLSSHGSEIGSSLSHPLSSLLLRMRRSLQRSCCPSTRHPSPAAARVMPSRPATPLQQTWRSRQESRPVSSLMPPVTAPAPAVPAMLAGAAAQACAAPCCV